MPVGRCVVVAFASLIVGSAEAADVVWLDSPTEEQRARVSILPGYTGEMTLLELRAGPTEVSQADQDAYQALKKSLDGVRAYETKLDGELIIMDDLQGPLESISIIRNSSDVEGLFKALVYQGFAVNRYFDTTLSEDEKAETWRASLGEMVVERPWRDASAIAPGREATTYDIAEAPQRVAFNAVVGRSADSLPGGLKVSDLPAGAALMIDGKPTDVGGTTLRLPPGRHWIHAERDGSVLARWDVVLEPGSNVTIEPDLTDAGWDAFVAAATEGKPIPEGGKAVLAAAGGEVWFARPGDKVPVVWSVSPRGIVPIDVPKVKGNRDDTEGGFSLAVALGAGWLSSGDFYNQTNGAAPNTKATVNTAAIVPALGAAYDIGLFRVGGGIDAAFTPGENHVALSGNTSYRLRPHPHLLIGTPYVAATAGWTFPYHPTAGLRAMLPLPGGLEIRGDARIGLGGEQTREDDSTYSRLPLFAAFGSIGWRIRP